jgi:hypothetical protein
MTGNNDSCNGMCPYFHRISRRDFIKVATVTSISILTACGTVRQPVAPLISPTAKPAEENLGVSYIAYCGTSYCLDCPEYKSTCAGCLSGQDEMVSDATANCTVRICSRERNLANCAYCEQYPCKSLEELYTRYGGMAGARATLDEIHTSQFDRE